MQIMDWIWKFDRKDFNESLCSLEIDKLGDLWKIESILLGAIWEQEKFIKCSNQFRYSNNQLNYSTLNKQYFFDEFA